MPRPQNFEILFEAIGGPLTVGEVCLREGYFDKSTVEGLCIRSGQVERLSTSGNVEPQTAGSLSLFAGREKIGTLDWDCVDAACGRPVDWTPLSSNYRTAFLDQSVSGDEVGLVKLRISPAQALKPARARMVVPTGQLGFAGI